MDPSISGRGAASTFRLNGRVVSREEYEEAQAAQQRKKRPPRYVEEDVEWKSGLAQKRAAERQQEALAREVRPYKP
jgi:hypothetical protein